MTSSIEKDKEFNIDEWIDPFPDVHGVLLSNYIEEYVKRINLIYPFDRSCLKPASYGLRLGELCYNGDLSGDRRFFYLSNQSPELIIPPNSIVFVSMLEKLNMPRYLIGRFNVKIKLVYQGLLLGTGPQVDPGFKGILSCPLHNYSREPITLEYDRSFATIDFIKTSPFDLGNRESEILDKMKSGIPLKDELIISDNLNYVLFPQRKLEKKSLRDYLPPGKRVGSSIAQISKKIENIRSDTEENLGKLQTLSSKLETRSTISIVGVFIGLALLLGFGYFIINREDNIKNNLQNAVNRIQAVEYRLNESETNINKSNVGAAEGKISVPKDTVKHID